ncbi:flagellar export chaperone FliS [Teredinibacter purpureus]|uniref:flagellar export chaperone FliS n=1 Tax=Teredinibacter purpureus TaxID=2731756 RepID=UPI0005F816FE|nr:flagellar export chaperone FliS [Teredinibacter purpureus]
MNTQFAVDSYAKVHRQSNVEVASPHKLIDMLYEGALERIVQAKGAIQYNNIELRGKKINSAIAIVGGLRTSLDRDQGGDIAANLDGLYVYIQNILAKAHRNADAELLDEAAKLVGNMRDSWKQIG